MFSSSLATEEPSSFQIIFTSPLPAEEVHAALRRERLGISRDQEPDHAFGIAFEARRRQLRDGRYTEAVDFEPDGSGHAYNVYPEDGGPEQALAEAGYNPQDPGIQDVIWEATSEAEEKLDGGWDWDSFDGRAAIRAANELRNLPDREYHAEPIIRATSSYILHRPVVRRGRAPRVARNMRSRGSRRGAATSSRAGPGDDDPGGEPGEIDGLPPQRGPVAPALAGGAV
jgi:hypothetical protein